MTEDHDASVVTSLSPDDAFGVLGNETRMDILRTLGAADGALAFSALYDRVDVGDSGQFSYHLDKLVGHFVRDSDDGYELSQAGARVIEAVLSGAITETPIVEPTAIDMPCPYCGGTVEVSYSEERLLHRCQECPGAVGGGALPEGTFELGYLPPAGVQERSPREMVVASSTWAVTERVAMSNGVCPRCAGVVEHEVDVCETHPAGGVCDDCHRRHAVYVRSRCLNCPHEKGGVFLRLLVADPGFREFFERRGLDLFSLSLEEWDALGDYDETVLGTDPFAARFSFTFDDDRLTVEVDDSLDVVDISRETN